jgi:hypothetical protein
MLEELKNVVVVFQTKISSGMRMSKPYYSPEDLYRVMSDCWHADPKMRPSFTELSDKLGETLLEGDKEVKRELLQLFCILPC